MIDWQLVRFASPVLDLYDVLLTTSDKKSRAEYYHSMVDYYYQQLAAAIRRLGSDPDKLFTYDDLMAQMKKFGKYGMILTIISIVAFMPQENGVLLKDDATAQTMIRERATDMFDDFLQYGFYP